jgi:DNA polymerase-3 subunit delta
MPTKTRDTPSPDKAIYVIAGKDEFLANVECQKLINQLLRPEQRTMGLFSAQPEEVTAAEIFDELRTLPLFSHRRVVLLKSADDFVSVNRSLLEKYFDNPSNCGILILTVHSWPKNTKLARKLPTVGRLITVGNLKGRQLPQYLITYANDKYSKVLSRLTAEVLVELVGDEPGRLCSELDKLAVFVGDQKTITLDHLEATIGHNRLFDAFAIIEAMTAGRTAQALERLRRTLAAQKDASYRLVGAFAFHFRRMFEAARLLERGSSTAEVAHNVGVWQQQDAFFGQVRKMGLERIATVMEKLAETDHAIKTGQMRAESAIEKLVLEHLISAEYVAKS